MLPPGPAGRRRRSASQEASANSGVLSAISRALPVKALAMNAPPTRATP
jgi:hypothetical protein